MDLSVEDEGLIRIRPRKALALEALREIQRAFAAASMTEAELQAAGSRVRQRISRRYDGGS